MRMLSGERVLTASHDGTVKMWDVRTDRCVATVGRCSSAVLCMEYDDNVGVLAAAGRDVYVAKKKKLDVDYSLYDSEFRYMSYINPLKSNLVLAPQGC